MWRLCLAIILFLVSLLIIFRAPTNLLWRVTVAITEFPYIPIFLSVLLFACCVYSKSYKLPSLIIVGLAGIIYTLPVIMAYVTASNLPHELAKTFPSKQKTDELKHPFSFSKQFTGIGIKQVNPIVLTYKTLPEKQLNIEFYSAEKTIAPCVIIIHGGSWSEGDSKQLPNLNSYLANRGYHVAAINYRLAPKYKFPAPIEDTKDVLAYLIKHARELNIDTNNFVLLGRSAGGQIALLSAYTFNDKRIKGVISLYAPADMAWGATINTNKWVLDVDKVFTQYLGGLINEVPDAYKKSTACNFVTPNSTPTLLIHGNNDALVAYHHSERLLKILNEKHVKNYFLSLPLATHGCDYNINGPSGQLSTYTIERFINSVTTK